MAIAMHHIPDALRWVTHHICRADDEAVFTIISLNGQFYLPQEQQVKQFVWYRFPMAWQAWLAPYTPFPHLTQIPVKRHVGQLADSMFPEQYTLFATVE